MTLYRLFLAILALPMPLVLSLREELLISSPNFSVQGSWVENVTSPVRQFLGIPGGALVSGGSAVPYTNGARLVAEQKDVILVSINYRVNIFGFPGAAGLDGKNLNPGILDQRMAVEWVYQNIGYFGGDASRMT